MRESLGVFKPKGEMKVKASAWELTEDAWFLLARDDQAALAAYYRMLPGITGLWQISARNESAFAERAFFDSRYDAKMSFMTDLKTLLATVRVVTQATGH